MPDQKTYKLKIKSVGEDMGKSEYLYTGNREVKKGSYCRKQRDKSSYCTQSPQEPATPALDTDLWEMRTWPCHEEKLQMRNSHIPQREEGRSG